MKWERELEAAVEFEKKRFEEYYAWLRKAMSPLFFSEVPQEEIILITHSLVGFRLQNYSSRLHLTNKAFALCLDSPDADVQILSYFRNVGIKNYRTYVSTAPLPHGNASDKKLRIAAIHFTEAIETGELAISAEQITQARDILRTTTPEINDTQFNELICKMNTRFLRALPADRLALAVRMFERATTRDHCQYEVRYNDDWEQTGMPSMQVILAWRNTPKQDFLYRVTQMIQRHNLVLKRFNATYIDPYGRHSILMLALGLHGSQEEAAWEAADVADFMRELVLLKYFAENSLVAKTFVKTGLVRGTLGNLLRSMVYFIHQVLVHADANLYSLDNVEEAVCRHPELTLKLCTAFEQKFHTESHDLQASNTTLQELHELIKNLDTGQRVNDIRRQNVLFQGINFIRHTVKTNFYRNNKTGLAFRLDPHYLDFAPFDRKKLFPVLPYAVFFTKGMHYIGFHVRFRDLARGGVRTVFPARHEVMEVELNHVFSECYNLALTQQKKNKDIPEGGAKGVIFLKPFDRLDAESKILIRELRGAHFTPEEIQQQIAQFKAEQLQEYLHQTQRSYVNSLLTLVNCHPDGAVKAKHIVDYYRQPEYLYLGPDERMDPEMIEWIASHSRWYKYKCGAAFISSKPSTGINHKEYGVTSLGVNVYMREVLHYLGIDPEKESFTVKISGGPDGDVAGNQIVNLHKYYPNTAKLVAITDISGTIRDAKGLDLTELVRLFHEEKPIAHYPKELLSDGAVFLNRTETKEESAYVLKTLCWRNKSGQLIEEWLTSSEAARLFHTNLHQMPADVFIPAGGRPRTLNELNYTEFLDSEGQPTSRAIVEGANLYLTREARQHLEALGVLIIKDSSANKCGVICSSFEVLYGLVLTDEEIEAHKATLVREILDILRDRALDEAQLMLQAHRETGQHLTEISDLISKQINSYTDQLLNHLNTLVVPQNLADPFVRCILAYCPPLLRNHYAERLLDEIPESHKKAIIASYLASRLVYKRGIEWSPNVVDILPTIWEDPAILPPTI